MNSGQCVAQMERAVLVRNGISWPVLVNGTSWRRLPIDDFFMGDRIQFPLGTAGMAVLRVVLAYGRMFRDVAPETHTEPLKANYEVRIDAVCPRCDKKAAHSIEVTPQEVTYCAPTWPLTRCCGDCGYEWLQEGSFPELFYDELLAAMRR
jgi:hypothetical protein